MTPDAVDLAQQLRVPPALHTLDASAGARALYDAEWLLAGGDGSFAYGTALWTPRKKYHSLLNASANPPVDRIATVHRIEETIVDSADTATSLGGWITGAASVEADIARAARHLERFERTPTTIRWTYRLPGIEVVRSLRIGWRHPAAAISYDIRADHPCELHLRPWVSVRDFHDLVTAPPTARLRTESLSDTDIRISAEGRAIRIAASDGSFARDPARAEHIWYDREAERGLPDAETLDSPGRFVVPLPAGTTRITIAIALAPHAPDFTVAEDRSREAHLDRIATDLFSRKPSLAPLRPLLDAADDFLVTRSVDGKPLLSVIAGYPWFADWGRDTMISLQGLMIAAGRHDDALACLSTFARHVSEGMIPNHFDDHGGPPHYNTVDASLWFLHGATEYLRATGDHSRFEADLLPACHEIIAWTQRGTRFGIRIDPADGLITAGDATTQLTWMDAKRDGVVFTPRHGKAVEINALWHHGLVRIAEAIGKTDPARAAEYLALAARARESFLRVFPDPSTGGLHDCLRPDAAGAFVPSGELRPNQIFAASLDRSPIDLEAKRRIVELIRDRLLTPVGLRTLAPGSPGYQPRFEGDMMQRDRAYHNGTVWPWLIGPFIEAHLRVHAFSGDSRRQALAWLGPLADSMNNGCLGQITEVLDGDAPRAQQGCTAQAWSVAEVFRAAAMALDRPTG